MSATAREPGELGLFYDMPIEQYHSGEGISNSGLLDMGRSPLHYFALHEDPLRPDPIPKAGQLEGTLTHCAVLEPNQFDYRYVVGPTVNRNKKEWHEFVAAHPTRIAIQSDQRITAISQSINVHCLPDISDLLAEGQAEVSAYWRDPVTGVLCRCRPDFVSPVGDGNSVILLDAKTYGDASPGEFARQVARKHYHQQAAFYSDGYAIASGKTVVGFVFLAIETAWPYAVSASMLDEASLEIGRRRYRELLDLYADCRRAGDWPGYGRTIELLTLPRWVMKEAE